MNKREELKRRQQALLDVYEEVKAELLGIPGVLGVGIGLKEVKDEITGQISFRVYVAGKKSPQDIPPDELIPPEIRGFTTDVLKVYRHAPNDFVERADHSRHRPLNGGICLNVQGRSNAGTLGWLAAKDVDDSRVLLTNSHVIYTNLAGVHTDVLKMGQPFYERSCCCESDYIGDSIIGIKNTRVDCAIASIKDGIEISDIITNDSTRRVLSVSGWAQAVAGETVKKIGMRSGYTEGVIIDIGGVATGTIIEDPVVGPIAAITDQIILRPSDEETYELEDGKRAFSTGGDSGSVVLNEDDEIVGLLHGSDITEYVVHVTFASNIGTVLDALRDEGHAITLRVSTGGGGLSSYSPRIRRIPIGPESSPPTAAGILASLGEDETLRPVQALFELHRPEVLDLINNRRPVTVAWHRGQGPAFLAAFLRSVKEPSYKIPQELNGISRQTLMLSLAAALQKYGSQALDRALSAYALGIIKAAAENNTAKDIMMAIGALLEDEPLAMAST